VKRVPIVTKAATNDLPGQTFQQPAKGVAYVKLSSIKQTDQSQFLESIAGAKGLIVDIRNYPSNFVVFWMGGHFIKDKTAFVKFTALDLVNPGAFHFLPSPTLEPIKPHFSGKVIVLVDEVTVSQAEYTTMAFRAAGAKVFGSTTAGADGDVSRVPLPGGFYSMISGLGVFYPNEKPTQRVGIVPDREVRPTIAGIREGRDEVLEAAVAEIQGMIHE
jgi:C-terminal processing protease CtpA/Prc